MKQLISQRYNRFHQLNQKTKLPKNSDTGFNGHYELILSKGANKLLD